MVAYAASTIVALLLGINGVTKLPSLGYVAVDLVLDVVLITGLWLLWRTAWIVLVALSLLGEAFVALHPKTHVVLLIIGAVQLALLLHPQLRRNLRTRPTFAS